MFNIVYEQTPFSGRCRTENVDYLTIEFNGSTYTIDEAQDGLRLTQNGHNLNLMPVSGNSIILKDQK